MQRIHRPVPRRLRPLHVPPRSPVSLQLARTAGKLEENEAMAVATPVGESAVQNAEAAPTPVRQHIVRGVPDSLALNRVDLVRVESRLASVGGQFSNPQLRKCRIAQLPGGARSPQCQVRQSICPARSGRFVAKDLWLPWRANLESELRVRFVE